VSRIQWDWCDITRLDIDKVLEKIGLAEKIRVSFDSIGNLKWNKKAASLQSRALTFALSISCRLTWS